jgi:hypothetical protein
LFWATADRKTSNFGKNADQVQKYFRPEHAKTGLKQAKTAYKREKHRDRELIKEIFRPPRID